MPQVILEINDYNNLYSEHILLNQIKDLVKDNIRIDFLGNPDLPADIQVNFLELMKKNFPDIQIKFKELKTKEEYREKENKADE